MAQIFISHSQKDRDLINFFSRCFAGTAVKAIFEEFEKICEGTRRSEDIIKDIEDSKAIFVILSKNVQNIPHTRDWVLWETGVAKNRDIWVFEPYRQFGTISVVIPYLRYYVIFDTSDDWQDYIRRIIESYDDSYTLSTALVGGLTGATIGAAIAKKYKVKGAVLGGAVGAVLGATISSKLQKKQRPIGLDVICGCCRSSYNAHIPQRMGIFRCPVCNAYLEIQI